LTDSAEKLTERVQWKNPGASERLKFPCAEGTAVLFDLRSQIRSAHHTLCFVGILGSISIIQKIGSPPEMSFSTE
jgi:hypothetical protein